MRDSYGNSAAHLALPVSSTQHAGLYRATVDLKVIPSAEMYCELYLGAAFYLRRKKNMSLTTI